MLRDISIALGPRTPEWPGDTPFSCGWTAEIARGSSVNLSSITMSPHVGTHADAPLHVQDGWPASHDLPLDVFAGPAVVCSVHGGAPTVELNAIEGLPTGPVERLLLKSGHSIAGGQFPTAWPALSVIAVRELLARGLKLLGVDAPSVDLRESKTLDVHHTLFAGGAYNIENLNLDGVANGEYELLALPVKVLNADAAPVRAALRPIPPARSR